MKILFACAIITSKIENKLLQGLYCKYLFLYFFYFQQFYIDRASPFLAILACHCQTEQKYLAPYFRNGNLNVLLEETSTFTV